MKEEFLMYLLGNLSVAFLLAYFVFAALGVAFNMMAHFKKREDKRQFNLKYWYLNNTFRVLGGLILLFIFAVGFNTFEFFLKPFFAQWGMPYELTAPIGFVFGIFSDNLIVKFKKFSTKK